MNEDELISEAMRALGRRKSPEKTKSCRANAKRSWTPEARAKRTVSKRNAKASKQPKINNNKSLDNANR